MNMEIHNNAGWFKLIILLALIPLFVFWLGTLVSAIKNKNLGDTEKICWVLAIIFLHFIGALLYLAVGRPRTSHAPSAGQPNEVT
jgi:hypothetical protein